MAANAWPVVDARARLSEVIKQARVNGPQTITSNGRPVVVLVAFEEWRRLTARKTSLAEFLTTSPMRGSGITLERVRDLPADAEL